MNASNAFYTDVATDYNGQYQVNDILMGVYKMTVSKNGYITTEQNVIVYEGQTVTYNVIIEMISESWSGDGTASGMIYDALTGYGVSDLTLSIRSGINNTDGAVVATCTTDIYGYYYTPYLESGNYCVTIEDNRSGTSEDDRYITTSMNIKVLGGMEISNQDGTVSNYLASGQVRIVLSWGESPYDLDSHLEASLDNGDYFHTYFGDPEAYSYYDYELIANLDLDDIDCYGPETTTIYRNDAGIYSFYVHNYSGGSDYALANSRACVQVYLDYSTVPSYVFYVPYEAGYIWDVFTYDSRTGVLTPINTMSTDCYY